jgi:hypothetical protein
VDRYFGSASLTRDRMLTRPIARLTNGYADPLKVRIDQGEEIALQPGESTEQALDPGRHLFAAACPDGVTRTEQRLMVPEFRYEWRIPALFAAGWP